MYLSNHRIRIPIDIGKNNLPVPHNLFVTEHQKREIGPQMRFSLAYSILSKIYVFGDLRSIHSILAVDISSEKFEIEH